MPRPPIDQGPPPPPGPPPSGDPIIDVSNAADWSADYYNRRAADQQSAIYALVMAASAMFGG